MIYEEDLCQCICRHKYGEDLEEECTDTYCGYCGEDL